MSFPANTERQLHFPFGDFTEATKRFAESSAGERGAVFTRREVVEFILDLVGYTVDQPLHRLRLLEPSFGKGDFLLPLVERLLVASAKQMPDRAQFVETLSCTIRAVEIHNASIREIRHKLFKLLQKYQVPDDDANRLLESWIISGDFLLVDLPHTFTHIVGNPPYVRQELIPRELMAEYRARYQTIYDRADLYVPFIERCLANLAPEGTLGFICSDRWMKNKYGGPLRAMVANGYHLACYVDMVDTPAFNSEVTAYPAITIIKREKAGPTRVAHRPSIEKAALAELTQAMKAEKLFKGSSIVEIENVARDQEPWILHSFDQLALVRRLETKFPTLEEAGCQVGIGVATGADRVFIRPYKSLDIEADRKLPLVKTKDLETGVVEWQGLAVINPFREDGTLIDLKDYPKLAQYFERHEEIIRKRNCAQKNPEAWYRTIDRIHCDLTYQPKLLIPDIKGKAHIVYEDGQYYPHHNLYFITSDTWDLKALQAVLRSGIAKLFVALYSTQMRGGYLRFQAQYLRRIRLPHWEDVSDEIRKALIDAANAGDVAACNDATFELFRLTDQERATLGADESEKNS